MQKTISLREDQYNLLDGTFNKFPNGMYMTYGDLIVELIKSHEEYMKIKKVLTNGCWKVPQL